MQRIATTLLSLLLACLGGAVYSPVQAWVLRGEFVFQGKAPEAALVYMAEDHGLSADISPLVDQVDKTFSPEMVVGTKGAKMLFRNSDAVSHNLFVDDKDANVQFDIGLINAGHESSHTMDWDNKMVRGRCKIHPKMGVWIASIQSQYHTIVEFGKDKSFVIDKVPEHLSMVQVWLPHHPPIEFTINGGEAKEIELKRGDKPTGALKVTRH
jgi:hypothetical protein